MGWEILFAKKIGCSKQIHLGYTSQNIRRQHRWNTLVKKFQQWLQHFIEGQNWKEKGTPEFFREVHDANNKFIWSKLEMTILELQ